MTIHVASEISVIDNRISKFLDIILRAIAMDKNVPYFTERKNGGHFERRAAIGRRNTPHYSYIAVTNGSEEVSACVHNVVLMC